MSLIDPEEIVSHPEYIEFLLNPNTPLDFHVNVGNTNAPDMETLGKIKVVKWMLIARSKVLRVMLLESEMRPKKSFDITDINRNTFKNFLVFIYGHDNTQKLPFDDAVDLLSVAEKYDVADMKNKLCQVVKSQVTSDNVLTILKYGPVCETLPDLWAKATDVIQTETEVVFGHPQFVTLRPEAVVHILQQEALSVEEIDVWKASLAWARHQLTGVGAEPSPQDLRRSLEPLLKHTRLCTVPPMDLCKEVAPTEVLTAEEYMKLCVAIAKELQPEGLPCVSNEIQPREKKSKLSVVKVMNIGKGASHYPGYIFSWSSCSILTKPGSEVLLTKFELKTNVCPWKMVPEGLTYECKVKVAITKVTNYSKNTSTEPPREITVNQQVPYDRCVDVNLSDIVLEANAKYSLKTTFTPSHYVFWKGRRQVMNLSTDDLEFSADVLPEDTEYGSHMYNLHYQTRATPKQEDLQAD